MTKNVWRAVSFVLLFPWVGLTGLAVYAAKASGDAEKKPAAASAELKIVECNPEQMQRLLNLHRIVELTSLAKSKADGDFTSEVRAIFIELRLDSEKYDVQLVDAAPGRYGFGPKKTAPPAPRPTASTEGAK